MSFFSRLTHVLAADAHGVVDAIEDDELVLKQCLRDAEAELQRKRAQLEGLDVEERRTQERLTAGNESLASLERDITLALEGDAEDLARFAIRRLLPLRKELVVRTRRLGVIERERQELGGKLLTQERDLEDLRARVRDHLAALQARSAALGEGDEGVLSGLGQAVAGEEIELELLRRRRAPGGAL